MKIKEEHLDLFISCPYTGKTKYVRELEPEVYPYYYKKGYEWLFEEVVGITQKIVDGVEIIEQVKKQKK